MRHTHTPGPWAAIEFHAPSRFGIESATVDRHVATVEGRGRQVQADALLIAAAPDLFAALVQCEAFARAQRTDSRSLEEWDEAERVARIAREALAKALPQ